MLSEKLRIAFVTPEYVTETHFDGGLANYLSRTARAVAALRHDVHVITLSDIDEAEFEDHGVMVHRVMLGRRWQLLNRLVLQRLPITVHWLNFSAQAYRKLKELNREKAFDLVQYPNYSSCGLFPILFLRIPHVVRASSYGPELNQAARTERKLDVRMVELLESAQFRLSKNVHAPSCTLQQKLAEEIRLWKIRVIPTPFYLETREWDSSVYDRFLKGKKYLLYFGRFQLHKGFHILAEALPRFLHHNRDAFVALVGRDMKTSFAASMADYMRARCGSLSERLIFLNKLPHSQLYPVIAGAHLVVLPSLIDNLPNACLEAMGLGQAIIGTSGASFEEVISDGATGFLVSRGDQEALAEKIIDAWTHPKLAEIGAAAERQMSKFSADKAIDALLTYYTEVLNGSATLDIDSPTCN